jgi:hypothetical protein
MPRLHPVDDDFVKPAMTMLSLQIPVGVDFFSNFLLFSETLFLSDLYFLKRK